MATKVNGIQWLAAREELPVGPGLTPTEEELKDYKETFHPLVQPCLNYRENDLWAQGPITALPTYLPWVMEEITEKGERGYGKHEMCEVFEGHDDQKTWIGVIVCKFCGDVRQYSSKNSDSMNADGYNLSSFQVCPDVECRATALLTDDKYVIDPGISIETGHPVECTKSCCNGTIDLEEEDDGT